MPNRPSPAVPSRALRTHLIALVAASLLPTFAVGAIAVGAAVRNYLATFDDRMEGTARALASAVDAEIGAHAVALSALAVSPGLDGTAGFARFHERAKPVADAFGSRVFVAVPAAAAHPDHDGAEPVVDLVFADGERRSAPGAAPLEASETGRPVIGNITPTRRGDRLVVPVFVPIHRPESPAIALGMALEPERLSRMLAAQGFDGGGYATVIDADGTIVARSMGQQELVGKRVLDAFVAEVRSRGAGILHGSVNRFGTKTITAFRRLAAAPGWAVIVVEPLANHRAGLWSPLAALAVGGLAALAVAVFVAARIGRRVLRPVRLLTRRAEAVVASGGDAPGDASDGPDEPPAPTHVREFARLQRAVERAEATLRERAAAVAAGEERLRAVVDTAVDAIVVLDETGTIRSFNRSAEGIFGYAADEAIGRNVSLLMGPGEAGWREGGADGPLRTGERKILGVGREVEGRRKGGDPVPLDLSVAEWRDAGGRRFFTGIMRDISARKADEARRLLLAREVDHRAKNALAVVQSVIRLTPAEEPAAFAAAVGARVAALARAHSLLAEGGWSGADMRAVAEREVAPYAAARDGAGAPSGLPAGGPLVVLDGPPVPLAAASVQAFAMVLHELVTNAAKHGALSAPGGRVDLTWSIGRRAGDDGMLRLRWSETGGPAVEGPPARRSFGTRMVEATIRGQLGGTVERRWKPAGLVVDVAVPLDRTVAQGAPRRLARAVPNAA